MRSSPLACGIAFPDLAERYPATPFRFWSRAESANAGGYDWLGGRASFTSAVETRGLGKREASFQVSLTPEHVNIYNEGAFNFTPCAVGWWWYDLGERRWERIDRRLSGTVKGPELVNGYMLNASIVTRAIGENFEASEWSHESHLRRYPDDMAFEQVRRYASGPKAI